MSKSNSETNNENELTMCDVLQEEQDLEDDAYAVLGGSDDTNCSYDDGYVPRQALYSCTTCTDDKTLAGICLACCYACHDGHECVELYTKRNFRCDCGNSKFGEKRCNLKPNKDPENSNNKYNQNFKGLYCKCSRPYPDLDDDTPDEMIQCIICEDWYHGRHLGNKIPNNEDYGEMICDQCMNSHKFLYSYCNYLSDIKVDIESCDDKDLLRNQISEINNDAKVPLESNEIKTEIFSNGTLESNGTSNDNKYVKVEIADSKITSISLEKENDEKCILKQIESQINSLINLGPAFLPQNWRKELCKCSNCLEIYSNTDCMFLLNQDDTIHAYEERGKCQPQESQHDKGLSALFQLDRVKQMECIQAYDSMKGELKEYLKDFAANKRTVCESHIVEFFEKMKRRKLNSGVPHFCR